MLTIRLFCNVGLSTNLMVAKLREVANERGIEADVASFPTSEIAREAAGVDCALLAPQAAGHLSHARETCEAIGLPVVVIPALDYGMVNASKVLDLALTLTRSNA